MSGEDQSFLWRWTRTRAKGPRAYRLRGVLVTALVLPCYGASFLFLAGFELPRFSLGAALIGASLLAALGAWIGWRNAGLRYANEDARYEALLSAGAEIPSARPPRLFDETMLMLIGLMLAFAAPTLAGFAQMLEAR